MTTLSHLVEPEKLLLTWQMADESAKNRTRRVVGEISKVTGTSSVVFRYLHGTDDFAQATSSGYRGFPAFRADEGEEISEGVIETLLRRLPPRKREDFSEFLQQHWLPHPFPLSDFALLGYTGAKLPSDGFALVPVFPTNSRSLEFVMEVAGTRHMTTDVSTIQVGDPLTAVPEVENPVDGDAIAILHSGTKIGYVNRALRHSFHEWLAAGLVKLSVLKKNGKPQRPLIYCRVSVT